MYDKICSYADKYKMFFGIQRVVVGLSGGADSVCLLHVLKKISLEKGFTLVAVHVHHGLRGMEADRDRDFCVSLCREWDVPLREYYFDVAEYARQEGITSEEAGRFLRYQSFRKEAGEHGAIAVAHHRKDQAETVIFNLCRGSGLRGIRGMLPVRDGIIRPLLDCDREEIEGYLEELGIPYETDSTNLGNEYTRNRIRNHVIPMLTSEVNQQAVKNIAALAEHASAAEDYLNRLSLKTYESLRVLQRKGVLIRDLTTLDEYLCQRVLLLGIGEVAGGLKDIGAHHVHQVMELLYKPSGTVIQIRAGCQAEKTQDGLYLSGEGAEEEWEPVEVVVPSVVRPWNLEASFEFSLINWTKDEKISNEVYTKCFDYDKIKFGLQLRKRQPGDYIVIDKDGHRKKLKQYFIDEKIPRRMREETILLADGNHIIWVVGGRIGADYRITDTTEKVIRVDYGGKSNGTH